MARVQVGAAGADLGEHSLAHPEASCDSEVLVSNSAQISSAVRILCTEIQKASRMTSVLPVHAGTRVLHPRCSVTHCACRCGQNPNSKDAATLF